MTRRLPAALVITGLTLAAAGAQAAPAASQYFRSPSARAAGLPFSEAVQVGGVIYLNNQLGNRPGVGQMVEAGWRVSSPRPCGTSTPCSPRADGPAATSSNARSP